MRIIISLIFLILIILESTLVPYPLTLVFFLALLNTTLTNISIWAFIIGLLLDLFSVRPLGLSGLFFLIVVWLYNRYQKKIDSGGLVFTISVLVVGVILYYFLFHHSLDLFGIVPSVVVGFLVIIFVRRFTRDDRNRVILDV